MVRNASARIRGARSIGAFFSAIALLAALPCAASEVVPRLTLVPESPFAGDPVVLREEVPAGDPGYLPGTNVSPGRIVVQFWFPDTTDDDLPPRTLSYPVGALAPGTYRVDYVGCANSPPPGPQCQLLGSEPFVVRGTATAVAVPATNPVAAATLSLLMLATFFLRSRRSCYQIGPTP